MMRIYLVRHGSAQPPDMDRHRRLTSRGEQDVRKIAQSLAPMGLHVAAIWHSGEARAKQTAEILSAAVRADYGIQNRKGLTPDADPYKAKDVIDRLEDDVMVVSHLPFLGRLAGLMLTANPNMAGEDDGEHHAATGKVAKSLAGVTHWLDQRAQSIAHVQGEVAIPDIIAFRHCAVACLERRLGGTWKIAWMHIPEATRTNDQARPEPGGQQFRARKSQTTEQIRQAARTSSRPSSRQNPSPQRTVLEIEPVDDMESSVGRRISPMHSEVPRPDLTGKDRVDDEPMD